MAEVGANQRHANHGIYVLCKAVRWAAFLWARGVRNGGRPANQGIYVLCKAVWCAWLQICANTALRRVA